VTDFYFADENPPQGFEGEGDDGFFVEPPSIETAYEADPISVISDAIERTASEVEARVRAQIEQEATLTRADMAATTAREADSIMAERHGGGWEAFKPIVAEKLKEDWASGRLNLYDSKALSEQFETHYLAEVARARPSKAEADAAYWERVKANPSSRYGER
jgi:hypothetical protein